MTKLRLLREGSGCRGYVMLTSVMRFPNFVCKYFYLFINLFYCWADVWVLNQIANHSSFAGKGRSVCTCLAEVKAWFKETARTITKNVREYRPQRRKYQTQGPDLLWHLDGWDKIKPYRFCVHDYVHLCNLISGCVNRKLLQEPMSRSMSRHFYRLIFFSVYLFFF